MSKPSHVYNNPSSYTYQTYAANSTPNTAPAATGNDAKVTKCALLKFFNIEEKIFRFKNICYEVVSGIGSIFFNLFEKKSLPHSSSDSDSQFINSSSDSDSKHNINGSEYDEIGYYIIGNDEAEKKPEQDCRKIDIWFSQVALF